MHCVTHVRTGGACTSERLEQFNLNTLERTVRYDRLDSRTHYDLKQQHEASSERIAELDRRVTSLELPWEELCSNYYLRYCGDTYTATATAGAAATAGGATDAAAGGLLCDPVDGLAALTVETIDADGFQLVGAGGKAIESDYLYRLWLNGQQPPRAFGAALRQRELWQLTRQQRLELCAAWRRALRADAQQELVAALQEHAVIAAAVSELKQRQQLAVLKHARVIGMTTTKAAMQRALLEELAAGVVIIEEVSRVVSYTCTSAVQ
jgi:hypothetical protein